MARRLEIPEDLLPRHDTPVTLREWIALLECAGYDPLDACDRLELAVDEHLIMLEGLNHTPYDYEETFDLRYAYLRHRELGVRKRRDPYVPNRGRAKSWRGGWADRMHAITVKVPREDREHFADATLWSSRRAWSGKRSRWGELRPQLCWLRENFAHLLDKPLTAERLDCGFTPDTFWNARWGPAWVEEVRRWAPRYSVCSMPSLLHLVDMSLPENKDD